MTDGWTKYIQDTDKHSAFMKNFLIGCTFKCEVEDECRNTKKIMYKIPNNWYGQFLPMYIYSELHVIFVTKIVGVSSAGNSVRAHVAIKNVVDWSVVHLSVC